MGLLITVEGGDYTGKTSVVVPTLKKYFEKKDIPVIVSREPGGTQKGEQIRALIFEKIKKGVSAYELAILFNKARKVHLEEVIMPFLGSHKEKRAVVILDRYLDSTRVYQGMEHNVPMDTLFKLEEEYINGYLPDFTYILYFPEKIFEQTLIERQRSNRERTEWDMQSVTDQLKRQQNYLRIPDISHKRNEKRKFFLIDTAHEIHVIKKGIEKTCDTFVKTLS